ncbi:MAG TPA: SET domain-containing protein-lysine N-methyltransferase [Ktedonobacterales bacterium]|jgi:SET domain-containing protein
MITDIEVRDTGAKGKGVFALRHFGAGEFIFRRRRGRIISNSEIATLSAEDQRHLDEIDENTSEILTSPGCYFNHACEPNAMPHGVDLYAWRDIAAGEEITVDYRLSAITDNRWDCACGGASCPGYFDHSFFALSKETQRRYLPYAPAYIRTAYRTRRRTEPVQRPEHDSVR